MNNGLKMASDANFSFGVGLVGGVFHPKTPPHVLQWKIILSVPSQNSTKVSQPNPQNLLIFGVKNTLVNPSLFAQNLTKIGGHGYRLGNFTGLV